MKPGEKSSALASATETTVKDWVLRIGMGLLLALAVYLVYYTHKRMIPVQKELRETNAKVTRLSAEVDFMDNKFNKAEFELLLERYNAARGVVFSDSEAMFEWFRKLKLDMLPLGLEINTELGTATMKTVATNNYAIIPATLSVQIRPTLSIDATKSPYQRLLQFSRHLSIQQKRADLIDVQIESGAESICKAVAILDLWAGQEGN
jgi:hypothetical protein